MVIDNLVSSFYTDLAAIDDNGKAIATDNTTSTKHIMVNMLADLISHSTAHLNAIPGLSESERAEIYKKAYADSLKALYNLLQKAAFITLYCHRKYGHELQEINADNIDIWCYAIKRLSMLAEYNPNNIPTFDLYVRRCLDNQWREYHIVMVTVMGNPQRASYPIVITDNSVHYNHIGGNLLIHSKYTLKVEKQIPLNNFLFQHREKVAMVAECVKHLRKH